MSFVLGMGTGGAGKVGFSSPSAGEPHRAGQMRAVPRADVRSGQAEFDPRVGAWLELDSEQLRAETPAQFRSMLSRIAKAAGLTAGQIAVKAGIPRSQAYALAKESAVLPRKPEQVRAFLQACNVSPAQVAEVMQVWGELSDRDGETALTAEAGAVRASDVTRDVMLSTNVYDFGVQSGVDIGASAGIGTLVVNHSTVASEVFGLTRHVLNDERRTNRALRLLGRLGIVLALLLGFLAYVLTLIPTAVVTQLVLGAAAVLGVVVSVTGAWFAVRRARRSRSAVSGR